MNTIIAQKTAPGLTTFNSANDTLPPETGQTEPKRTRRYTPRARKCGRKDCDVQFTPKAKHGKYCSDYCRKLDNRRKQRRLKKRQPRQKVLDLFTCEYCTCTFLATKGSRVLYCKPYHRTLAYHKRKAASVKAIMGDMNVSKQLAEDGLEMAGMKQVTAYLTDKGYQYDSRLREWVLPINLQQEIHVPT